MMKLQPRFSLLTLMTALLLCGCAADPQQDQAWLTLRQEGFSLFEARKYSEAIAKYQAALDKSCAQFGSRDYRSGLLMYDLVKVYVAQDNLGAAEPIAYNAVDVFATVSPDNAEVGEPYANCLRYLAMIERDKGNRKQSESLYEKALELARKQNNRTLVREILFEYKSSLQDKTTGRRKLEKVENALTQELDRTAISDSGATANSVADRLRFREQGKKALQEAKLNHAEKYYRSAMMISQKSGNALEQAQDVEDLAKVYLAKGEQSRALFFLEAAMQSYQSAGDTNSKNFINCLNTMASCYLSLGQYLQARQTLQRIASIYKDQSYASPHGVSATSELMADTFLAENKFQNAIPFLEKTRELRSSVAADPVLYVVDCCNLIGSYDLTSQKTKADAVVKELKTKKRSPSDDLFNSGVIAFNKKQYALAEVLLKRSLATPNGNPKTAAQAYYDLGLISYENKQYGEAKLQFDKAIALMKKDPSRAKELCYTYFTIGTFFGADHSYLTAEKYLKEGLTVCSRQSPKNKEFAQIKASMQHRLGVVYMDQKNYDLAEKQLREAASCLSQSPPSQTSRDCMETLGRLLKKTGNEEEGQAWINKALEIQEALNPS